MGAGDTKTKAPVDSDMEEAVAPCMASRTRRERPRRLQKSASANVALMRSPPPSMFGTGSAIGAGSSERDADRLVTLSELVSMDTKDLPDLPKKKSARRVRRPRMRALSDGVSAMRLGPSPAMSSAASAELGSTGAGDTKTKAPVDSDMEEAVAPCMASRPRQERHRRKKSLSANVALMRSPPTSLFTIRDDTDTLQGRDEGGAIHKSSPSRPLPTWIEDTPPSKSDSAKYGAISPEMATLQGMSDGKEKKSASPQEWVTGETRNTDDYASQQETYLDPSKTTNANHTSLGGKPSTLVAADESETVDSAESVGGDSDFDDVPELSVSERAKMEQIVFVASTPLHISVRRYVQTNKFRVASGVCLTMICFFLVGMRIEILLIDTCVLEDNDNTWHPDLSTSFWLEFAWLCMIIAESVFFILLFAPRGSSKRRAEMILGGLYSFVVGGTCLFLLVMAEAKRCCSSGSPLLGAAEYTAPSCVIPTCDCPAFGSRKYSGVGDIEPFTSIIALSALRFYFSRKVVVLWRRHFVSERDQAATSAPAFNERMGSARASSRTVGSLAFDTGSHGTEKAKKAQREAAVDLWRSAIGLYPDIVEQYGEFSGELLQAMLGIEVIDRNNLTGQTDSSNQSAADLNANAPNGISMKLLESMEVADGGSAASPSGSAKSCDGPTSASAMSSLKIHRRYKSLPESTQSIIIAGILGKPVRTLQSGASDVSSGDEKGCSIRDPDGKSTESPYRKDIELITNDIPPTDKSPSVIEFKIDMQEDAREKHDVLGVHEDGMSLIIAPNARLIRSMRRCERVLPPLLDEWAAVDVVLTQYEMVYFEAIDLDEAGGANGPGGFIDENDMDMLEKRRTVREALIATSGGKGLRLRDVAIGRKVVGHLELSTVDYIKVERLLPTQVGGDTNSEHEQVEDEPETTFKEEYWSPPGESKALKRKSRDGNFTRKRRWEQVEEDRLKIRFLHSTMYLRFFCDLEEWEVVAKELRPDGSGDHISKNYALLWCQTIARLCGTDQLQQDLPHFGQEGLEEQTDFVDVLDRAYDDNRQGTKGKIHRFKKRVSSARVSKRDNHRNQGMHTSRSSSDHAASRLPSIPDVENEDAEEEDGDSSPAEEHRVVRFATNDDVV